MRDMSKIKLPEANKKAKNLIEEMANERIKNSSGEELYILFLIRDGIRDTPLDAWKLEEYDNNYDVDLFH